MDVLHDRHDELLRMIQDRDVPGAFVSMGSQAIRWPVCDYFSPGDGSPQEHHDSSSSVIGSSTDVFVHVAAKLTGYVDVGFQHRGAEVLMDCGEAIRE